MNVMLKNIIRVTMSNIISVMAGIVVGFVLPKTLSINDYGYYKIFTLYGTYTGLSQLGIIDGIVLRYGNKDYDQLNRGRFRAYFIWYMMINLTFALAISFIALFVLKGEFKFIFTALGLNIVALNVTNYFQQISQITRRFNEYSFRNVIKSMLTLISVALLLMIYTRTYNASYRHYLLFVVVSNFALTLWYIYTYRDLVIGKHDKLLSMLTAVIQLIKVGFPLFVANICSTLILTIDRQIVSIFFDNATYAVYAFAYNMLALVTVATSAISAVLYPTLKRTDEVTIKSNYSYFIGIMLCFVCAALCLYFPLCLFINWYLPNYKDSLIIFRIIFPGLAISSSITVVMHNYYKALGDNFRYFLKSVVTLAFAAMANLVAFKIFKTTVAISAASLITMILWYLYVNSYIFRKYNCKDIRGFIYLIIVMTIFYLTTALENYFLGLILYLLFYAAISIAFYRRQIVRFFHARQL